jgi:hypothetical protein
MLEMPKGFADLGRSIVYASEPERSGATADTWIISKIHYGNALQDEPSGFIIPVGLRADRRYSR